jgi:hypothetical protein
MAISDGAGGFWCQIRNLHNNNVYLNHYYYNGERLYDSLVVFQPEGMPDQSVVYLSHGIGRNGGFDSFYLNVTTATFGICSVTGIGQLIRNPQDGLWNAGNANANPLTVPIKRSNGLLAFLYYGSVNYANIVEYEPSDGSFPLGVRGRLLHSDAQPPLSGSECLADMPGDMLLAGIGLAIDIDTTVTCRMIFNRELFFNRINSVQ